jgi:hypothetical protein
MPVEGRKTPPKARRAKADAADALLEASEELDKVRDLIDAAPMAARDLKEPYARRALKPRLDVVPEKLKIAIDKVEASRRGTRLGFEPRSTLPSAEAYLRGGDFERMENDDDREQPSDLRDRHRQRSACRISGHDHEEGH